MLKKDFNREINSIENYYLTHLTDEEKERWYEKLHNLPLNTILRAKTRLFDTHNDICTLEEFLEICKVNFSISDKVIISYMELDGYFINKEIVRKVKYYAKVKMIPSWLKRAMEKYKDKYFDELLNKK